MSGKNLIKNPNSNMQIRTNTVICNQIKNKALSNISDTISKLFSANPAGVPVNYNPKFISDLVAILTPIITANVIQALCDQGIIDSYYCYYNENCCGDNNVRNLNNNLNNFINMSNTNDNDFSLLSTEIFEDTSVLDNENTSVEIQDPEIPQPSESIISINTTNSNQVDNLDLSDNVDLLDNDNFSDNTSLSDNF